MEITPQLQRIAPMDANFGGNIYFTHHSPKQIVGNQVEVRDVETTAIEYSFTHTSFERMHPLPPRLFVNGRTYSASVRVQYIDGTYSPWSNTVQFRMFATPVLDIMSIDGNGNVFNENIQFVARYSQADGEPVRTYRFTLYDENEDLLRTFPLRQPTNPSELTELVEGLEKGKGYFIKCTVETVNGMVYDHKESFIPLYIVPSTTGIIQTVDDSDEGFVRITAMLRKITGTSVFGLPTSVKKDEIQHYRRAILDPKITPKQRNAMGFSDFQFIDNEWVVVPRGRSIIFRELGMNRASDFTLKIWCSNLPNGKKFLRLSPEDNSGVAYELYKYADRIVMRKEHAGTVSSHRSNIVTIPTNAEFYVGIRQIEHRPIIHLEILH